MTHEEFDQLVRQVEEGMGRDERLLVRHVRRLAIVGYAGLVAGFTIALLPAALFIVSGIIFFRETLVLLPIGIVLLVLGMFGFSKAVWIKLPIPEGHEVKRSETPGLYTVLDEIRRKLRSAPFHHVLIIPDWNAAVVQRPRLGAFGWFENYLLLGLPLLENFSADEMSAILIHECAHLAHSHGQSSQWIYRLRRSWEQIFPRLARPMARGEISFRPLLLRFVRWFWPRFNAHAFVLSRQQEYQADAVAARLGGARTMATALVRSSFFGTLLEKKFWPELWLTASRDPGPPADVMERIHAFVQAPQPDASQWLELGFRVSTTNGNTHPCLSARLRAIAVEPEPTREFALCATVPPAASAAFAFLGHSLPTVRVGVQVQWRAHAVAQWSQQHAKARALKHRLEGIEEIAVNRTKDVDAWWDKAQLIIQLEGEQAAVSLLRQIIAAQPRHAPANFALGRILLQANDATGETFLQQAMVENEQLHAQALPLFHSFYQRQGEEERIRELYARMDQFEKSTRASQVERQNVSSSDVFLPHGLEQEQTEPLRKLLADHPGIAIAHLAQKELKHFAQQKLYLLNVELHAGWRHWPNTAKEQALVAQLVKSVKLPGRVLIFAPRGTFRGIARKIRDLPNTVIYTSRD